MVVEVGGVMSVVVGVVFAVVVTVGVLVNYVAEMMGRGVGDEQEAVLAHHLHVGTVRA